ncbi:MAG: hypothetical protein CBC09_03570 [Cellvibrionales bacterium TMED49]|nr:MAG: hypothetical protein CBC09_03570 [Cellvibrionales bacterium TMED49]|tara:strand:- start:266 stop:1039 length:774 start_codon:yes stop_codon:yes gene_type:complete
MLFLLTKIVWTFVKHQLLSHKTLGYNTLEEDDFSRWTAMLIDWNFIDTVFIDMDGTLLDLNFDNEFWTRHLPLRCSELLNQPLREVQDKIRSLLSEHLGTLNWYSTKFWSQELCVDILELKREISHLIKERPGGMLFLKTLLSMNKSRILLTNADRGDLRIKCSKTDLINNVDLIISSHDYGFPKESTKFWEHLRQNVNFDPQKALFIDDSEVVLHSAKIYGIAFLTGIEKPDSRAKKNKYSDFVALQHFDDLIRAN